MNAHFLHAKSGESGCASVERKELPLAATPRELALVETARKVTQKPKNGY